MKPINNMVIVRVDPDFEKSGSIYVPHHEMRLSCTITRNAFISVSGVAEAVPDRLLYYGEQIHKLMMIPDRSEPDSTALSNYMRMSVEYNVPAELLPGDRIWFSYIARHHAIHIENNLYAIPYDSVIIAKRNNSLIPINGCIIAEPIKKQTLYNNIFIIYNRQYEMNVSKVLMCGTTVKGYKSFPEEYDTDEIKPGHIIYHDPSVGFPIESPLFASLPTTWRYLWRKDIFAYE